jgi:hypothetical protein
MEFDNRESFCSRNFEGLVCVGTFILFMGTITLMIYTL